MGREVIEATRLGVEAASEVSARLEDFFNGTELTEEFCLGGMEDLPFGVLTEEGGGVFKNI